MCYWFRSGFLPKIALQEWNLPAGSPFHSAWGAALLALKVTFFPSSCFEWWHLLKWTWGEVWKYFRRTSKFMREKDGQQRRQHSISGRYGWTVICFWNLRVFLIGKMMIPCLLGQMGKEWGKNLFLGLTWYSWAVPLGILRCREDTWERCLRSSGHGVCSFPLCLPRADGSFPTSLSSWSTNQSFQHWFQKRENTSKPDEGRYLGWDSPGFFILESLWMDFKQWWALSPQVLLSSVTLIESLGASRSCRISDSVSCVLKCAQDLHQ